MMRTPIFFLCILLLGAGCYCIMQGKSATDETQKKLWMRRCILFATAAAAIFWFFGFEAL